MDTPTQQYVTTLTGEDAGHLGLLEEQSEEECLLTLASVRAVMAAPSLCSPSMADRISATELQGGLKVTFMVLQRSRAIDVVLHLGGRG